MQESTQILEWSREEVFIEGEYYPKFQSKTADWCYTIYPFVKPKYPEPTEYHFSGWTKEPGTLNRPKMEGTAKTVGECTAICEGHHKHIAKI